MLKSGVVYQRNDEMIGKVLMVRKGHQQMQRGRILFRYRFPHSSTRSCTRGSYQVLSSLGPYQGLLEVDQGAHLAELCLLLEVTWMVSSRLRTEKGQLLHLEDGWEQTANNMN